MKRSPGLRCLAQTVALRMDPKGHCCLRPAFYLPSFIPFLTHLKLSFLLTLWSLQNPTLPENWDTLISQFVSQEAEALLHYSALFQQKA